MGGVAAGGVIPGGSVGGVAAGGVAAGGVAGGGVAGAGVLPVRSAFPLYVNVTEEGNEGNGGERLLLLTSTVFNVVIPVSSDGITPVSAFPDNVNVSSDVRFARDGEILPVKEDLLNTMDVTTPVAATQVTPVHEHGSPPIHVEAIACGYPTPAKKSKSAFTCVEHGTPGPAQNVVVSTEFPDGNTGSSPQNLFPLPNHTYCNAFKLPSASGNRPTSWFPLNLKSIIPTAFVIPAGTGPVKEFPCK